MYHFAPSPNVDTSHAAPRARRFWVSCWLTSAGRRFRSWKSSGRHGLWIERPQARGPSSLYFPFEFFYLSWQYGWTRSAWRQLGLAASPEIVRRGSFVLGLYICSFLNGFKYHLFGLLKVSFPQGGRFRDHIGKPASGFFGRSI